MSIALPKETQKEKVHPWGERQLRSTWKTSIPRKKRKQPFCSFGELFGKGKLVPRMPTTSLPGEENEPRLIRKTSTLVSKMKTNSSQRDNQPVE